MISLYAEGPGKVEVGSYNCSLTRYSEEELQILRDNVQIFENKASIKPLTSDQEEAKSEHQ